jgi:hypothetical protein
VCVYVIFRISMVTYLQSYTHTYTHTHTQATPQIRAASPCTQISKGREKKKEEEEMDVCVYVRMCVRVYV